MSPSRHQRCEFSDFVQVDEGVAVSGALTDAEILCATDTNEKSNDEDEDDTSEPLTEVSGKEARSSFDILQRFCLQNESDEKTFEALFVLRKVIESAQQQCVLKQTSITEFFRNINYIIMNTFMYVYECTCVYVHSKVFYYCRIAVNK